MIEIFKVVVWPGTIMVLGIIAMHMFKPAINNFLARVKGLKGKNFELNADPTKQSEAKVAETTLGEHPIDVKNQIPPEMAQRRKEVTKIDVSPIVLEQEQLIRKDIEALKIPQSELTDILIKHLAVTQLTLRAETIYRMIFGSQIDLLKAINHFGPRTRDEAMGFYNRAKIAFPSLASYPFDNYVNFLISHGLMTQGQDGKYAITMAGKEFLKYLIEINATGNKPF